MLGGNLALASLLAARWVESGHFPLSNMYESLLFLAWGITGVHLYVTERDGFSKTGFYLGNESVDLGCLWLAV